MKIYLYYIATKNPAINIERVDNRVEEGGHFVPKDKIESRYYKTMENLYSAILLSDKAYLFDNSNDEEKRTYSNFAKVHNLQEFLHQPPTKQYHLPQCPYVAPDIHYCYE